MIHSIFGSMYQDEIIKQLQEQNKQLKLENELLKARVSEIEPLKVKISELEARLAHEKRKATPLSLRRGRNRKKDRDTKMSKENLVKRSDTKA